MLVCVNTVTVVSVKIMKPFLFDIDVCWPIDLTSVMHMNVSLFFVHQCL